MRLHGLRFRGSGRAIAFGCLASLTLNFGKSFQENIKVMAPVAAALLLNALPIVLMLGRQSYLALGLDIRCSDRFLMEFDQFL